MHLDSLWRSIYVVAMKRHQMSSTPFARVYYSIRNRCNNQGCSNYRYYGGRGIRCEWDTFEQFLADMHESYVSHVAEFGRKNTLIERKDNDRNYCKENCCWKTKQQQADNKRNNLFIEYQGRIQTASQWARELGITREMIKGRIYKGWTSAEALTTPARKNQYA